MLIQVPDNLPFHQYKQITSYICLTTTHEWNKGRSNWRCDRCGKKRRRRNRPGGR